MTTDVKLPQQGMGMTEGTVTKWLKAVGESVKEDEVIAEVEAAKATIEIEAPASGVLSSIMVKEDETVPVGSTLATIDTE